MLAAFAFQTNISAQANHRPLVRTAGMRLTQTQLVFHLQVGEHERIIPPRTVHALAGA